MIWKTDSECIATDVWDRNSTALVVTEVEVDEEEADVEWPLKDRSPLPAVRDVVGDEKTNHHSFFHPANKTWTLA